MKTAWRLVYCSAAIGFILPILMLLYLHLTDTMAGHLFVTLCPTCMASMALDNASILTGVIAWLLICTSNALLYSIPALIVAVIVTFARRA